VAQALHFGHAAKSIVGLEGNPGERHQLSARAVRPSATPSPGLPPRSPASTPGGAFFISGDRGTVPGACGQIR
jgi:hypothetical protein